MAQTLDTEKQKRAATRKLVTTVVLAQGNIFVRELLRRKELPIGATKEDFEKNLLDAIDSGKLQLDDVNAWLNEVEGWGDQHIYLYHLPKEFASASLWQSARDVRAKLPATQKAIWDAQSLSFPDTWELTGITFTNRTLTYVWHERYVTLQRYPKKDDRKFIDGDWYRFRAFIERPDRSVMRFVVRPAKAVAAVFMQIPAEGDAHEKALERVWSVAKPVVDMAALKPVSTSDIMKNLNQAELDKKKEAADIKSRKARLTAAEAYVEFGTNAEDGDFLQSAPVRNVRLALQLERFVGSSAIFGYSTQTPTGLARPVTIEIFGEQRRIKLRAQLKADEVWGILDMLGGFENV